MVGLDWKTTGVMEKLIAVVVEMKFDVMVEVRMVVTLEVVMYEVIVARFGGSKRD